MSDKKFGLPIVEVRNPLGIIALFISFIYALSTLVLGLRVGALKAWNETILVVFIVFMPLVVLRLFYLLVKDHHHKLYAPQDYESDDSFFREISPKQIGKRLRDETSQQETVDEVDQAVDLAVIDPSGAEDQTGNTLVAPEARPMGKPPSYGVELGSDKALEPGSHTATAYMAEGLVFQKLQAEFSASVRRNVSFKIGGRRFEVDGVLESSNGRILVSTKTVFSPNTAVRRVRDVMNELEMLRVNFPDARTMGVIVALSVEAEERCKIYLAKYAPVLGLDVQVLSFSSLLGHFGIEAASLPLEPPHQSASLAGNRPS